MASNARGAGFNTPALFNDFFRPWNELFGNGGSFLRNNIPAVNVSENQKEYRLSMAAPGLSKDDFKLDVHGNLLTIHSEKEEQHDDPSEKFTRHEYSFTSFSRSFSLPEDVQVEKINATYKDGVLQVELPRRTLAENKNGTKAIPVK
jgi:HSP20 family protein